jgi:diguanylate cyclase (GGDEF)-like protein
VALRDDEPIEPQPSAQDTLRATPSDVRLTERSHPSLPSLVPDDEEPEDTVAAALAPLRQAELGPISVRAGVLSGSPSLPPETFRGSGSHSIVPGALARPTLPAAADVAAPRRLDPFPIPDLRLPDMGPEHARAETEVMPSGLEACLAQLGVAVIEASADGVVLDLNAVAARLTGWPSVEARGAKLGEVFRLREGPADSPELADLGAAAEPTALLERRDGQVFPIQHVLGRAHGDDRAAGAGRLLVFRDLSGQQLLALQLARQARHDALTGLLNRRAMAERVELALAESRRRGARHALCYFDLDRFRLVNATCGHDAGDDLLQWVATRLHEFVGPSDAAGRIGGDEFALLLTDCDAHEGERVARELQRRLLEFRFGWEEKTFTVGASFGLVFFGPESGRAADVLSAADHACRLAKDNGRGRIQIYLDGDDQTAQNRRSMQWVAGLGRHLEDGRLRLFAQTIHPLNAPADVGTHFEVLVRLVGDDGALQSPVGIIQAAEHSGMMDAIDRFVVKQALRVIGALPQRAMRRLDTCAINLSGISLLREGLLTYIVQEMQRSNVPPSKICFEITETAALANLGEVLWLMQELGAMGCRFAIDDFGSGQASYGYIETLPVDYVKIDGMFVRDLPDNALHRAIVESVHRIGCTLGIKTVAEAVETQAIADQLKAIGVHYAQGWLYSRPRPIGDVCGELDVP